MKKNFVDSYMFRKISAFSLLFLSFIAVIPTFNFAGDVDNHFGIYVDAMWMQRNGINSLQVLDYDGIFSSVYGDSRHVVTSDMIKEYSRQWTARITLNMQNSLKNRLELRAILPTRFNHEETHAIQDEVYAGYGLLYGVNVADSVLPEPLINFNNTDYLDADKGKVKLFYSFASGEANWWWFITPQKLNLFAVSSALGLTYIRHDEEFKENLYKNITNSKGPGYFSVKTQSSMYGPKGSFAFDVNAYSFFSWGIRLGLGVCASNLSRLSTVVDHQIHDNVVYEVLLKREAKHAVHYGIVSDGEFYADITFLDKLHLTGGAGATLIHGSALSTDNINLTTKDLRIRTRNTINFQSWNIGLGMDF